MAVPPPSWRTALGRTSGSWGDAAWYDLHLERKLPLAAPCLRELIFACPPANSLDVCDLLAGSGRASAALVRAYPDARSLTMIDQSQERLDMARARVAATGAPTPVETHCCSIGDDALAPGSPATLAGTPDGGFHLILASLALRTIVEAPKHYANATAAAAPPPPSPSLKVAAADIDDGGLAANPVEARYAALFALCLRSLAPGGTLLIGDHERALGCYRHLRIMEDVGFEELDVSWRQQDFFVCGGRRPELDDDDAGSNDGDDWLEKTFG